jgi:hypothetical protein
MAALWENNFGVKFNLSNSFIALGAANHFGVI